MHFDSRLDSVETRGIIRWRCLLLRIRFEDVGGRRAVETVTEDLV